MDRRELLLRYFFNRPDVAAVVPVSWKNPCPVDIMGTAEELIQSHLAGNAGPEVTVLRLDENRRGERLTGRFRVGSYTPDLDGNTRWLVIDIDGAGHSDPVADPLAVALALKQRFEARGLTVYLEKSGGGHGWHLWVFFEVPVPAAKVRRLALALIPSGIALADGGNADPTKSKGVEVFPKTERIAANGFGHLVYLPWWCGTKDGANQFYGLRNESGPHSYTPDDFETNSEATIDRILTLVSPTPEPSTKKLPASGAKRKDAVWAQWRRDALAALQLEDVYGEWLTGKRKKNGWRECRDPESKTGDRTPSASVADGSGEAERGLFHSFRDHRKLPVFDFLIERGRATVFKEACQIVAELSGVEMPKGSPPRQTANLPQVQVNNRQLRDLVSDAWRAIDSDNSGTPALFRRCGELVHIADSDEQLCIEFHDEASVVGHLARVADWVRINANATVSVSPPKDLAKDLIAYPSPHLPKLEAILRTPLFGADGQLLCEDGYYPVQGVWLEDVSSLEIPAVPQDPSRADVARARRLICEELLGDFPFVDSADLAHIIGALLLPAIRRMIEGVTPLHVVSAPIAGSGKGLLCDIISICHSGSPCPVQPISAKEEEIRKVITSQLCLAPPIILLDNARERTRIDSASLAAVLTADMWTDRILSESRIVTLPNRALWLLTGNNPQFSTELARRSVRSRIDPQQDQPWLRTGFRHRNLRAWTLANRAKLLAAMFVLVRAWQRAGCPVGKSELGSFERWSQVIGGILTVAEIPGFLTNLDDFYASSDDEGQMWRDFVHSWWDKYGTIPKRVSELQSLCDEQDLMIAVRSDGSPKSQETRLGIAIRRACDRVYVGRKITLSKDGGGRGKQYQLVPVVSEETADGVTSGSDVEPLDQGYTPGYTSEAELTEGVPGTV